MIATRVGDHYPQSQLPCLYGSASSAAFRDGFVVARSSILWQTFFHHACVGERGRCLCAIAHSWLQSIPWPKDRTTLMMASCSNSKHVQNVLNAPRWSKRPSSRSSSLPRSLVSNSYAWQHRVHNIVNPFQGIFE